MDRSRVGLWEAVIVVRRILPAGTLLTVLLAVSAVGGSEASAALVLTTLACSGGVEIQFCWSKEPLAECGELDALCELQGEGPVVLLGATHGLLHVPSIPVDMHCKKVTGKGTIKQPDPLGENTRIEMKETFEECLLEGSNTVAERCEVPATIVSQQLLAQPVSGTVLKVTPETGTVIMEIAFTSKAGKTCPSTVIGTRKVTGFCEFKVENPGTPEKTKTLSSVVLSGLLFVEKALELELSLTLAFENEAGEETLGGDLVDFTTEA